MTKSNNDENPSPDQDYEVGYGRPPKATRFKAGQSGNPRGRKCKPKSVQAQMRAILSKRISITEGGKTKRLALQEVILRTLANNAAKGDLKATSFVFNLLNSPEHAETDAIDQSTLPPEDRALLDQMMCQLLGTTGSEDSAASAPADADHQVIDVASDDKAGPPCAPDPDDDDGVRGGRTDV